MSSFDPFPLLETPRLFLRALTLADAEAVFRLRADPAVVKHLGRAPDASIAEAEARLVVIQDGVRDHTSIRWGFTLRDTGELIGSGGFWKWIKPHRWAEIGYELAPEHWGRGLMTEALRAILRFGFESMELHRVEGQTEPANVPSRRVLEKLGFVEEGLVRENWLHEGQFTHSVIYGLLARDFDALRTNQGAPPPTR